MINTVLSTANDMGGAFSAERLALAGQMTLLGMAMIFAVLSLLWGVLTIFKFIFAKPAPKKVAEAPKPAAVVAEPVVVEEQTDDTELIAILTAAIAAYESANGNEVAPGGFRVVSFRRANGGKAWNSK